MERRSIELAVGVFVLVGIAFIAYLTIRLGRMEWFGNGRYPLYARFQSVAGLRTDADVQVAGVTVGRVGSISLDQKHDVALVKMQINKGVGLTEDTIASVVTMGFFGEKYIKLSPGGSERVLQPGETIVSTQSAIDLEELLSRYVFGKT